MSLMTRSSTVDGIIRRSAKTFRDRPAVIFGERTLSYAALDDAVTRAAAHLLDLGLTQGDRVAAYGKNSDAYLVGFLACARAGLVHVPLNYNLTGPELSYLVTQSGSRAILHDPALATHIDLLDPEALDQLEHRIALRDADGSSSRWRSPETCRRSMSRWPTPTPRSSSTRRGRRRGPRRRS